MLSLQNQVTAVFNDLRLAPYLGMITAGLQNDVDPSLDFLGSFTALEQMLKTVASGNTLRALFESFGGTPCSVC